MKVQQFTLETSQLKASDLESLKTLDPHLVLVFASLEAMQQLDASMLHAALPQAQWAGCSTAGEISNDGVSDQTVVLTGIRFETPAFKVVSTPIAGMADSEAAGKRLAQALNQPDLKHILVLGQGANINGSALVAGITGNVAKEVLLTGGLAGDGGRFTGARVLGPHGVSDHDIVGIGFYGPTWHHTHGSYGGWKRFGPTRQITRCEGNVLYELDGERALDIYKRYLGDYAAQLPASGLLFPWSVLGEDHSAEGIIRTILGISEADGSLILAGDIPQGGYLQLMQASVDALVEAAEAAAEKAMNEQEAIGDSLAILVSCVGRKLVMGGRVEEEVEAVSDVFGNGTTVAGFYSNGEISPLIDTFECKLHNQTMTITLLREIKP